MASLTLVILCYNEKENLIKNEKRIEEIEKAFEGPCEFSVLFEEDGSRDGSKMVIKGLVDRHDKWTSVHSKRRLGKGGGLNLAMANVDSDHVIISDADFPIPTEDYVKVFKTMKKRNADAVIVNRYHRDSHTEVPLKRRILSRGYNLLIRSLFFIDLSDTQCGVKGFKSVPLRKALPKYSKRYTMDVEILYRMKRNRMTVLEIPAKYTHGTNSKFRLFSDTMSMLGETVALRAKTLGKE